MQVICFGDSNTWGYDPRSFFGSRCDHPWPELLAVKSGLTVINEGENGRCVPVSKVFFPEKADLLILMLGTNDLLQGTAPETAAMRMADFLAQRTSGCRNVLLLAPPHLQRGAWVSDSALTEASRELNRRYRLLADALGLLFADAGEWNLPLCFDGVHLAEEGHRILAEKLLCFLTQEGYDHVSG